MSLARAFGAAVLGLFWLSACRPTQFGSSGITPGGHTWFPIADGGVHVMGAPSAAGPIGCDSCHSPTSTTFTDISCVGCHEHAKPLTDMLHLNVTGYVYGPISCVGCHPTGARVAFDHAGITGGCAACHDVGAPFAALPVAGFTHPVTTADCGACHTTAGWGSATTAPTDSFDPARSVSVTALIPSFAGTTIAQVTPMTEVLPMVMNHASPQVPAALLSQCVSCHPQASQGGYFPGTFHAALGAQGTAQPTACMGCHAAAAPTGFVGATASAPARQPSSGEMKHDAVVWADGGPTSVHLVPQDCGVCHQPPTDVALATWATGMDGGAKVAYHGALTAAGLAQPSACLDCHANTRPTSLLTSANAVLSAGLQFDHQAVSAMGECAPCHGSDPATRWTSWRRGVYHQPGSATPATCLPCHAGERPTSTAGWKSTTYTASPFDYVAASDGGVPHGANGDCVVCHAGPGTGGAWGTATQNWLGGTFPHGPRTAARSTCVACHRSQRPDLLGTPASALPDGFDHAISGTGDCYGCHQATVKAGRYVDLYDPQTHVLPGGDWKGGSTYPGDVLVASLGNFVNVTELALTRTASNFITGIVPNTATLNNAMLHTSAALPPEVSAGPPNAPVMSTCWHCHTNTAGVVTDFTGGLLHQALTRYAATPDSGVTGLPQPTTCADCHEQMRPEFIVEKASTSLTPMDHDAGFTGAVVLRGASVTSVGALECRACHASPGQTWADGTFHANIGAAVPADCAGCHYPLVVDGAKADVASTPASRYAMKHRSTTLAVQACDLCHPSALSKSTTGSTVASWQTGVLHASLTAQPAACNDCHLVTLPAATTQSATVYALAKGATASNGGQWMSHGAASVVGKDCVACHAQDAKKTGSAWSKAISFHAAVPGVTTCKGCHGGAVPGTNNNLPAGLTDSSVMTTSSASPANTPDQITHADTNVTRFDCNFCHTQLGSSTTAGVQGKEWAQARFHVNFTASNPLVITLTGAATGRCSNCHMNVKPGTSYTAQDHSAYTATSAQDCSSCHAWPGSGTASAPNWKGATGAHASSGSTAASTLDCNTCHGQAGSSTVHLGVAAASHYGGVSNGNRCVSCHVNFAGFKGTTSNLLYAHSNASANTNGCVTCHAFSASLYTTLTTTPLLSYPVTSGGHTFSQGTSVKGSFNGDSFTATHANSGLTRCGACHQYSTTTATTNIWAFKHRPSNPGISNSTSTSGCTMCH